MRKVPRYSRALESVPATYFNEYREAFAQASQRGGGIRGAFCELAGLKVCFRFVGEGIERLILPAFAHAEISGGGRADLTIHCWDNRTTGEFLPLLTPALAQSGHNNLLGVATNARYRAFYHDWMGVLSCIDLEASEAYYCTHDAAQLPICERATPMKHLLNVALNRRGRQLIHGAAVGFSEGSLILAGAGGTGKSTTALTCLKHGFGYQADDLCAVSGDDAPISFSLYNTAKLRPGSLDRFPAWGEWLTRFEEFGEEKSYLYVQAHLPERMLAQAQIRALVFPKITGEKISRLTQATPLEAMRSVIPWTMRIVPTTEKDGERILLRMISRLPAYHLHLGNNEEQTVELLRDLLRRLGGV